MAFPETYVDSNGNPWIIVNTSAIEWTTTDIVYGLDPKTRAFPSRDQAVAYIEQIAKLQAQSKSNVPPPNPPVTKTPAKGVVATPPPASGGSSGGYGVLSLLPIALGIGVAYFFFTRKS